MAYISCSDAIHSYICGKRPVLRGLLALIVAVVCISPAWGQLAPTPPMGWNSWDAYGTTVREDEVRANAKWMAQNLKQHGWQYVVVDMEWFLENPQISDEPKDPQFSMDPYGRYTPAVGRFPSAANGAGFRPLADYVHSLGLKFGIHMLHGIPREAVEKNLPIAGSSWHAADAANTQDTCPWNPDNYGVDASKPAAQAWYDSQAKLWASWGVDFVKVDCVSGDPWPAAEVAILHKALERSGRPIVLSLSPGQSYDQKEELRANSNLWRVSSDVWDRWKGTPNNGYPQGLYNQFDVAAEWSGYGQPNHWPDLDMLPLGHISIRSVIGKDRQSSFTHDEQRTLMTLWAIFRSPLMMGGDLPSADAWTQSLLTNDDVLRVDQHSVNNRVDVNDAHHSIWLAEDADTHEPIVAVFNLDDESHTYKLNWTELGLRRNGVYRPYDLWLHEALKPAASMDVTLAPHASVLYRLKLTK